MSAISGTPHKTPFNQFKNSIIFLFSFCPCNCFAESKERTTAQSYRPNISIRSIAPPLFNPVRVHDIFCHVPTQEFGQNLGFGDESFLSVSTDDLPSQNYFYSSRLYCKVYANYNILIFLCCQSLFSKSQ